MSTDACVTVLSTTRAFRHMMAVLAERLQFAVDTESDSLYSYYPKVCLLQISVHGANRGSSKMQGRTADPIDYLVDTLHVDDLGSLGPVLAHPESEVVMHAAENDLLLLQREFGFSIAKVFDTQLAARILGWQQVGLAAILEKCFNVVSNKSMQRTNWSKRPLAARPDCNMPRWTPHYLFRSAAEAD